MERNFLIPYKKIWNLLRNFTRRHNRSQPQNWCCLKCVTQVADFIQRGRSSHEIETWLIAEGEEMANGAYNAADSIGTCRWKPATCNVRALAFASDDKETYLKPDLHQMLHLIKSIARDLISSERLIVQINQIIFYSYFIISGNRINWELIFAAKIYKSKKIIYIYDKKTKFLFLISKS